MFMERQCSNGKGGDWFYSEGKMKWNKKTKMYATQKRMGMCEVVNDKAMESGLQDMDD
jgi:hypothetical protein